MEESLNHIVYSKNVIEFVTVAKEYCTFMETALEYNRYDFITISTRLLPLLYLKASVLNKVEPELEESVEKVVDEMTYIQIQEGLKFKLGRFNEYLEVFNEEMQRSDTPVISFIAEDLSDIYQDLKNFISAYRIGVTEIMNDALAEVISNFELYWGQRLVNTLRALHSVKYGEESLDEEEGEDESQVKRNTDDWFISRFQKNWQDEEEDIM